MCKQALAPAAKIFCLRSKPHFYFYYYNNKNGIIFFVYKKIRPKGKQKKIKAAILFLLFILYL
jgi:hypothetical protein